MIAVDGLEQEYRRVPPDADQASDVLAIDTNDKVTHEVLGSTRSQESE